jgi:hypothetical protein
MYKGKRDQTTTVSMHAFCREKSHCRPATYQEREEIRARAVLKNDVWQVLSWLSKAGRKRALFVVNSVHLR